MERMTSIQFAHTPSANKKRITAFLPSLVQVDNGAAMLNNLQHSNDYEGRRVTHSIAVPTTLHSPLDNRAVAKPWKGNCKRPFTF
ncbi:hypothetical protein TNCV_2425031 [Trichonephila clavipes]|nr:hypothetical protein TNCV_2425031 [Trichonephila clavipes]